MTTIPAERVTGAVAVIPCHDLDATLDFFRGELGFRIDVISPADDPSTVLMSGHGARIRLQRTEASVDPGVLQLLVDGDVPSTPVVAPNGTRVEFVAAEPGIQIPPIAQSLTVSRLADSVGFHTGRAGMTYRDLDPDRQGGRFIASHIRIADGGPVKDYVHFHQVRFQMIYVHRGWVKVVYEDQGEPFVMHAGDLVLQPPTIRHRVLESSDGMEVIEVGCPAEHDTLAEHVITLPTGRHLPERTYGNQLFTRHVAAEAPWLPFRYAGFVQQDLGIGAATDGLAAARVIRPDAAGADSWPMAVVDNEFLLTFVLDGTVTLDLGAPASRQEALVSGDCAVIPADQAYALRAISADARILEVSLPADLEPRVLS